jgi:AbrB family looped-hinge helix DNA binding protein
LDSRGRLVLPADLRRRLGLRAGDEVNLNEEPDGSLRIQNRRAAAYSLIGLAGRLERSVLEDLATERQEQSRAEEDDSRPIQGRASAHPSAASDS